MCEAEQGFRTSGWRQRREHSLQPLRPGISIRSACDRRRGAHAKRSAAAAGEAARGKGKILTFLNLEFGTDVEGATPLGDIALTLVSVDELLRDLAAIAAYPSQAEFRNIEVVAIETRQRLRVKLSLLAIPPDAINAFQDICRDIIVFRERADHDTTPSASAWQDVIARRLSAINDDRLTTQDARRIQRHMDVLVNAAMPLRRVEVKKE